MRCLHLSETVFRNSCVRLFRTAPVLLFFASLFGAQIARAIPVGVFPDKYAAIVLDSGNGRVLFADRADARRYPASLTKMMTLYLLFDALKAKRIFMRSLIPISAYANSQPPTKLNLMPGDKISVELAIKALIAKSANDVAVAVAEYLGGSEKRFTQAMNLKARQLGMRHTNFVNASGLPDMRNYSTARDLATLSLALQRHFPEQYASFKTTGFVHKGRFIRGHNRLVAYMPGVDGIKTGYTLMSGFNLASSRHIGNKGIVAVVLGGKTSALRDSYMAGLLTRYIDKASGKKVLGVKPKNDADSVLMAAVKEPAAEGSVPADDFTPPMLASIPVPTAKILSKLSVGKSDYDVAAAELPDVRKNNAAEEFSRMLPADDKMSDRERDSALLMMLASQAIDELPGKPENISETAAVSAVSLPASAVPLPVSKEHNLDNVVTASLPVVSSAISSNKITQKKWAIQLAASKNPRMAQRILGKAKIDMRKIYAPAEPYTEKVVKSGLTYYRVRFSNFVSPAAAQRACVMLKKIGYKCIPVES